MQYCFQLKWSVNQKASEMFSQQPQPPMLYASMYARCTQCLCYPHVVPYMLGCTQILSQNYENSVPTNSSCENPIQINTSNCEITQQPVCQMYEFADICGWKESQIISIGNKKMNCFFRLIFAGCTETSKSLIPLWIYNTFVSNSKRCTLMFLRHCIFSEMSTET